MQILLSVIVAMTLAAGYSGPAVGASQTDVSLAVVGGRLIDGFGGTPIEDSVVLISGNRIIAVGSEGRLDVPEGVQVVDSNGMTVMPGLIDLHVHFELLGHADYGHWFPAYRDRMRSEVYPLAAQILLEAGVTSARDLGADLEDILWLKDQINSGAIPGPRTFVAGPFLRKGRGTTKQDYNDTWVVTDPADGRRKVRQLAQLGVDVIKTQDERFSEAELRAIYTEARLQGLPIATHLFTQPAIRTALAAGIGAFDTLEHIGDGPEPVFAPDIVQGVVESEVGVVPTEIAIDGFRQLMLFPELRDDPDFRNDLPDDIWRDVRASYDNFSDHPLFHDAVYERDGRVSKLRQLKKAGARFYLGTDSGTRGNPHHSAAWREMVEFVGFGLSPMEVIMASTYWPARVLRRQRDLGTVAVGKLADLIIVDGDPLRDMAVMGRVEHVVKDGVLIR